MGSLLSVAAGIVGPLDDLGLWRLRHNTANLLARMEIRYDASAGI
jgi:hypothetical protein